MNNTMNDLEAYLNIVKAELGHHPDAEDIIQELRAHIWDVANGIAAKIGSSVEESFIMALEQMEEPQILGSKFQIEELPPTPIWKEPRSVLPEKKLTDREFILLGIIGLFAATVILSIISWVDQLTDTNLDSFNFIVGLVQVAILIALIVGFLYYRNEHEFKNQVQNLRDKFGKMEVKEVVAPTLVLGPKTEKKDDCLSDEMKDALELHFQGLFQIILGILVIIATLYITFIAKWDLFTDYWFSIGLFVVIFLQIADIIKGTIKMFVGEIRISRLIHCTVGILYFLGTIIMVVFYPYDIAGWFETITDPTARSIVDAITSVISRPDYWFRIFMIVAGVFALMDAFYNLGKFGMWEPSHQKSLTIKPPLEESL